MLEIAETYFEPLQRLGLITPESISGYFLGANAAKKTGVSIIQGSFENRDRAPIPVFFKRYDHFPPSWKFIGRRSKARREVDSYRAFIKLGIPCAEWIAWGEERGMFGRLKSAFIITRAIPEAVSLLQFFQSSSESRELRDWACVRLAELTRRIHSVHFYHHDLVWRNILVNSSAGQPQMWWIDCPRGGFDQRRLWQQRKRVKDLASLDKSAALHCTPRERTHFLKTYLGVKMLDPQAKTLARAVVRYRKARWPEDWTGV